MKVMTEKIVPHPDNNKGNKKINNNFMQLLYSIDYILQNTLFCGIKQDFSPKMAYYFMKKVLDTLREVNTINLLLTKGENMKKIIVSICLMAFLSACATNPYTGQSQVSKTAWGTGIGTAVGAGIGAIAGGKKGALIGAGVGAAAGLGTGAYMDAQAKKLRLELQGTGVQVAQEGDRVYLIMPGNITFGTNEAVIRAQFQPVLNSVAKVINEYNKTMVEIIGYTDSTGSAATNNALSLRRANAVSNYLRLQGVDGNRIVTDGLGSKNPIASNATAAGREQNRRVEITLINRS